MQIHSLSRPAKLAFVLVLSLAIILPLIALVPRYVRWRETQLTQKALESSFTASVSDTLSQ